MPFRILSLFALAILTANLSIACTETEGQTQSACEKVLSCALERCITNPNSLADDSCVQECYCDQACEANAPSCKNACLAASAESFGAVEDFKKLNTCMAQNGCQDESCARSKCAYAYQSCLFSDDISEESVSAENNGSSENETRSTSPPGGAENQGSEERRENTNTGNENSGGENNTENGSSNIDTSFVGSPCTNDESCGAEGAICLDLPGGYCTLSNCAGTSGTCPEGSQCYSFQDEESYCLDSCQEASECRVAEGYTCDSYNSCWPKSSTGGDSPVGGPCATDSDCADEGAQCYPETSGGAPTGFINGYCIIPDCTQGSCPDGALCEAIFQGGGTACMAACAATEDCRNAEGYSCLSGDMGGMCFRGCGGESTCPSGYACDAAAQYCIPACTDDFCGPDLVCADNGLCEAPPCTEGSCMEGMICSESGKCVPDLSGGPGPGPGPICDNLPSPTCVDTDTEKCGDIIPFEPNEGPGYHDYDLNGEGYGQYSHGMGEYRSFARRDLMILVKWAAAYVACKSEGWTGGNGYPIGLGDMSESNGAIPGTAVGSPGHPPGTHVDGYDIDIAYYQNELTGQPNNFLRSVCDHEENGADQYHCISEPYMLDLWRSSLFIGALFSSPRTRVIGVDGKIGAMIEQALEVLCADGWVPAAGCEIANQSLGYEVQNEGMGWYYHHHHHLHLSLFDMGNSFTSSKPCLTPDCSPMDYSINHLEQGLVPGHVRNEEFLPVSLPRLDQPLW